MAERPKHDALLRYREHYPDATRIDAIERALLQRVGSPPHSNGGGDSGPGTPRLRLVVGTTVIGLAVLAIGIPASSAVRPGHAPESPVEPAAVVSHRVPPVKAIVVERIAASKTSSDAAPVPTPARATMRRRARPPAPEPVVVASEDSSLARELALIDGARAAIASDDFTRALHLTERYGREFPRGSFVPEQMLLRGHALCGLGRATAARELLHELRRTHPGSVWSERALTSTPCASSDSPSSQPPRTPRDGGP